jgi:DNA modification methylase
MPTTPTTHRLIIGDCSEMINNIPTQSVNLVVTSPPYFNAQLGFPDLFPNYEAFLELMTRVAGELYRVLGTGRVAALVVDDVRIKRRLYPIVADVNRVMEQVGFRKREEIAWLKPEGYIRTSRRSGVLIQHPYPMYSFFDNRKETILILQKGKFEYDRFFERLPDQAKANSRVDMAEWQKWSSDVWCITNCLPTRGRIEKDIAAFPDEIPRRLTRLYSFWNETVLDPFVGSGTVMKIARELGRNSIGIEIRPELETIIRTKTGFCNSAQQKNDSFSSEYAAAITQD